MLTSIIAWSHLSDRRKERARINSWAVLAREGRGRFQPPRLFHPLADAEMVSGFVVVKLDSVQRRFNTHRSTFTRASARFAFGKGPRFFQTMLTNGLPQRTAGWTDLSLDGGDYPFYVRCPDIEATRLAWTARAQELCGYRIVVRSTGEAVSVERQGVLGAGPKLEAMIALAGELASFGARDVANYASLPDVELHLPTVEPPSPFRCVLPTKVGEIELRPAIGSGEPGLSLWLRHEQKLPLFETELADLQSPTLPVELLRELSTVSTSLQDATLANIEDGDSHEETLLLYWPEMPEEEIVARGVELLIAVASHGPSVGAFR